MILLTGATGYIASHTWLALEAAGYAVAGIDDFSNSSPEVLRRLAALGADVSHFVRGRRPRPRRARRDVRRRGSIDAVVHFAASKAVGESVAEPLKYYANNVGGLVTLAEAMQAHGCKTIVFSSSATVYGQPERLPIREDAPLAATNPYGATKLMSEEHPARHRARRSGVARRPAALLQPGRRARERNDRRGPARHAEQPDALRRPGRGRQAAEAAGLRRRLRHARRHRRARLPPRRRPRRRPRRGAAPPARRRALAHRQPRHRPRPAACSSSSTRSSARAAGRCRTRSSRGGPGDVAACYADPTLAAQTIGWKATRDLDRMCADSLALAGRQPERLRELVARTRAPALEQRLLAREAPRRRAVLGAGEHPELAKRHRALLRRFADQARELDARQLGGAELLEAEQLGVQRDHVGAARRRRPRVVSTGSSSCEHRRASSGGRAPARRRRPRPPAGAGSALARASSTSAPSTDAGGRTPAPGARAANNDAAAARLRRRRRRQRGGAAALRAPGRARREERARRRATTAAAPANVARLGAARAAPERGQHAEPRSSGRRGRAPPTPAAAAGELPSSSGRPRPSESGARQLPRQPDAGRARCSALDPHVQRDDAGAQVVDVDVAEAGASSSSPSASPGRDGRGSIRRDSGSSRRRRRPTGRCAAAR